MCGNYPRGSLLPCTRSLPTVIFGARTASERGERGARERLRGNDNAQRREREREREREGEREREWIISYAPIRTIMCMQALYRTILDHMLDTDCIHIQLAQDDASCIHMPMRIIYGLATRNFVSFYSISFAFLLH